VSLAARTQFLLMLAALVWSGIAPHDRTVWLMESSLVIVGGGAMALLWRRFAWTPLALALTTLYALILCVGAHYTYALTPLGEWMRTAFGLQRNHYDRIGHMFQGVITPILARELLLRWTGLKPGRALFWVAVSIALAIAALHELVEWRVAVLAAPPDAGLVYLGGQGDVWDAQWDMAMALCGALLTLPLLGPLHDRQLARMRGAGTASARRDMPAPS